MWILVWRHYRFIFLSKQCWPGPTTINGGHNRTMIFQLLLAWIEWSVHSKWYVVSKQRSNLPYFSCHIVTFRTSFVVHWSRRPRDLIMIDFFVLFIVLFLKLQVHANKLYFTAVIKVSITHAIEIKFRLIYMRNHGKFAISDTLHLEQSWQTFEWCYIPHIMASNK